MYARTPVYLRPALIALVVVAAFVLPVGPAHAADPVITDLRIDAPEVVTVGDHVGYTVVVEVDEGVGIALAAAAVPPEIALVAPPETTRAALGNGREEVTLRFELAPFVAGDVTVPPLPLRYTRAGGEPGIIEVDSTVIHVTSVLPAAGPSTPRDLKPQAEVGTPPPAWPLPVLVGLVTAFFLLLIAALVRRRIARHRELRSFRVPPIVVGPEDITRGLLDRAAANFAQTGDHMAYYTAIGNAVRYYLTQRYHFPAFALTTRELEAEMQRLEIDRWQLRVASGLLTQCDTVVYARYRPATERADADLTAAYEIVEMSRPDERPAAEREGEPVA